MRNIFVQNNQNAVISFWQYYDHNTTPQFFNFELINSFYQLGIQLINVRLTDQG